MRLSEILGPVIVCTVLTVAVLGGFWLANLPEPQPLHPAPVSLLNNHTYRFDDKERGVTCYVVRHKGGIWCYKHEDSQ